jgi:hypothetical protein
VVEDKPPVVATTCTVYVPGTAHDEEVNVRLVEPGILILLLPKVAVTPVGNPLTDIKAVEPLEAQVPGLPIVTVVEAVSVFGEIPISFTVPVEGEIEST